MRGVFALLLLAACLSPSLSTTPAARVRASLEKSTVAAVEDRSPQSKQRKEAAVFMTKKALERLANGENVAEATSEAIADYMSQKAEIPTGAVGTFINKVNDWAHEAGAPKEVQQATQTLADAVPSNFIHTSFRAGTRVLRDAATGNVKGIEKERDAWAKGDMGAPLQGFGYVSKGIGHVIDGHSLLAAGLRATKGSEDTLVHKIGSKTGDWLYNLLGKSDEERKAEEKLKRERHEEQVYHSIREREASIANSLPMGLVTPAVSKCRSRDSKDARVACGLEQTSGARRQAAKTYQLNFDSPLVQRDIPIVVRRTKKAASDAKIELSDFDLFQVTWQCAGALHTRWLDHCISASLKRWHGV